MKAIRDGIEAEIKARRTVEAGDPRRDEPSWIRPS